MDELPRTATASTTEHRRSGTRRTSTARGGTFDLYTGTQQSVNTFFAEPRAADRALRALPARQGDGHRPDRPGRASGCRRSPSASPTPARWRWPRPTPPSPPGACTATPAPVTAIEDADGNLLKEYPSQLHAGAARRPSPTPSTTSSRASWSPAASAARDLDRPAGRRQDRHHPGRQGRLVRRLHPEPGDRRDDRRRQPGRASRSRSAGQTVGGDVHLRAPPAPASPARCGATRCR